MSGEARQLGETARTAATGMAGGMVAVVSKQVAGQSGIRLHDSSGRYLASLAAQAAVGTR